MIVTHDERGAFMSSLDEGYPASPDALDRVRALLAPGHGIVDVPPNSGGSAALLWHYPNGIPTPRPRLEVEIGQVRNVVTLAGIPEGARVDVRGPHEGTLTTDGQPVELEFHAPGSYVVTIDAFPHLITSIPLTVRG